ncbi:MAG: phosphatidylinositol-specific phospholipase C domain-containing protein, partial [Flavobacteriales bacterium]|nr:phosphatidylinositol-specific phospholipase C domain-containing protein [Flavobacteriales bacterium]
ALFLISQSIYAQCNGHSELCDKRFNQVAYLTTHNAFNAGDDGFTLPNQTHGLTQQLAEGVRALMLDVYDEGGVATVYHGFSFLGTATLETNLTEIKDFLDANPNEVVCILFETYISANMMDTAMTQVGLKPMLHAQVLGEPWPTLQEMIEANKRLVFFSDHNNAQQGQDWYHYMWDFAVETDFDNNAQTDFSCAFNRGQATNDLFILNHFLTDATFSTGVIEQAQLINQFDNFYNRIIGCQAEHQKFVNFPTVDFYEVGQTLQVVDSVNGVASSVGISNAIVTSFSVSPNPSNGVFRITMNASNQNMTYSIYDISGKQISNGSLNQSSKIDLSEKPQGIYILSVSSSKGTETIKLVKLPN